MLAGARESISFSNPDGGLHCGRRVRAPLSKSLPSNTDGIFSQRPTPQASRLGGTRSAHPKECRRYHSRVSYPPPGASQLWRARAPQPSLHRLVCSALLPLVLWHLALFPPRRPHLSRDARAMSPRVSAAWLLEPEALEVLVWYTRMDSPVLLESARKFVPDILRLPLSTVRLQIAYSMLLQCARTHISK